MITTTENPNTVHHHSTIKTMKLLIIGKNIVRFSLLIIVSLTTK